MTNPVLGFIESRIASAPATDTVVRTSLDELTSVTLTRIPKKATPVVKIVHCGETVAMDSSDLTRESARRKLVEACGDDIQVFVQRSLLELGDYWTNVATDATVPVAERKGYLTCETDPWPRAVDADELLSELRRQIVLHVALPAHADVVLALWIAHTHWISGLIFTPYLWLTSPTKQCGKTTVLELCELLARRAWRLSNPSSAALLRVIASERPTLLLDEIDTINGPKLEDLTGILNDGFHVNGKTARCVGDDHDVKTFSVFCAKAIAGIGTTLQDATRSRCIRLPMARATADELGALMSLRTDRAERWAGPLRSQLARLSADTAADVSDRLREGRVMLPKGIHGREAQIWEPLFAIADLAGPEWAARAHEACVALVRARRTDDDGDTRVRLLRDVRSYFRDHGGEKSVSSRVLVDWLIRDESLGWAEFRGRALSPDGLARLLKPFGVGPTKERDKKTTLRVWRRAALEPVWSQYLPVEVLE